MSGNMLPSQAIVLDCTTYLKATIGLSEENSNPMQPIGELIA